MLEMLDFSTLSTVLLLKLPMLSTKEVLGDRFITLSLEEFSIYMDIMADLMLEMLEFFTMIMTGYTFISVLLELLELPMPFTKKVVGDMIITLSLEMNFSHYMGTTANPMLEMPEFSTKSYMGHLFI